MNRLVIWVNHFAEWVKTYGKVGGVRHGSVFMRKIIRAEKKNKLKSHPWDAFFALLSQRAYLWIAISKFIWAENYFVAFFRQILCSTEEEEEEEED